VRAFDTGPGSDGDGHEDVVYVFEPHTITIPPLRSYLHELWERRRFVTTFARAEIQGQRSTMLAGQLWALLDPMLQAFTYFILISVLRGGAGGRGTADRLTLLIGCLFLFNLTRVSAMAGAKSVVAGRGLLLNSSFPRALLPITSVYRGLLELVPAAIVYLAIHVAFGQPIGGGVVFLPVLLALHTGFNLGIALLLAALTVYIRDMSVMLGYVTRIWLFITPVLFPVAELPPNIKRILAFNPLFPVFAAYQEVMMGGVPTMGQVLGALLWAVLFLVIGGALFLSHERAFALYV
jgi:teichoic acid transport system permease protein